jgi:hypothetical protein
VVPTDIKRLWLRERYSVVSGSYATLLESIQALAFASVAGVRVGTISATAANGHSVQFASLKDASNPEDYAALGGEMLDLYDASNAALIASGVAAPTDAQLYTEMLDRLQAVTSFTSDYTNLRQCGGLVR